MRLGRDIAFALLGAVLAIVAQGWSRPELEAAIGRSDYCCLEDGTWWQSPHGWTGTLRPATFEIGVRERFGNFSLRAAYVDLGKASGENWALMRDMDFGRFDPYAGCDVTTRANCLGKFSSSQHVRGILAGAAYGRAIYGARIEGEIGAYFYKSQFEVTIYCPQACGAGTGPAFDPPETYKSYSSVRKTPYLGARLYYKNAFLQWRRFNHIDGNGSVEAEDGQFAVGLTNGPVNQLMVGYALSL